MKGTHLTCRAILRPKTIYTPSSIDISPKLSVLMIEASKQKQKSKNSLKSVKYVAILGTKIKDIVHKEIL